MNLKLTLLIILGVAVLLLVLLLLFQRKRRRRTQRSSYIDALYALIDSRREDALRFLTKAVKNGEGDIDAYLQLGNLLRERNQAEKALQIHRSLTVRRDLGYEEEKAIQLALAEDLASLGRIERAIQTLEPVYVKKRDPDVHLMLHTLYHQNGDYDKAFTILKDLSRIDGKIASPERAGYLVAVSERYHHEHATDEARKYLERAFREDRDSTPALYLSGVIEMKEGNLERASEMWKKLLSKDISYFKEVAPLLEKVLYESGRFQELEEVLNGLLERNRSEPAVLGALASFYEKKGELDRAIDVLEGERAMVTGDFTSAVRLASLYMQTGRYDDARRVLEEIDRGRRKPFGYRCGRCGHRSEVPHRYCSGCYGFNTFEKEREHESPLS
jgi:lipopolysaccharide biosynthesis regulator YciM